MPIMIYTRQNRHVPAELMTLVSYTVENIMVSELDRLNVFLSSLERVNDRAGLGSASPLHDHNPHLMSCHRSRT